jgi:hypothetical protein
MRFYCFFFFWKSSSLLLRSACALQKGNTGCAPFIAFCCGGGLYAAKAQEDLLLLFFWEGLSLQAKQRSAPPKKPRACLSQAPTKRGVCASLPAALLPVDATHVAAVPITPAAISAKLPAVARSTGV